MGSPLISRIDNDLKAAMKTPDDKVRLSTLRLILAAVRDKDIAARARDRCCGLADEDVLAVLKKMVKQREDSAATYEEAGRIELAEQERQEIEVINAYLPPPLSEQEIDSAVDAIIADLEAKGLKDIGKCMGALKARYGAVMDLTAANRKVKERLAQ